MADTTLKDVKLDDGTNSIIIENDCRKEAVLTILPLYLNDSDLTDVFDFGGTIKVINLTGVYIGENIAALKTWTDSVEALIQGHQDIQAGSPYTFTDDLRGTIKVKILDFGSTKTEGESTKIAWTLKLVQASENA
ncbi:hypothetical protein ES703_37118 [subsurface metagenome]